MKVILKVTRFILKDLHFHFIPFLFVILALFSSFLFTSCKFNIESSNSIYDGVEGTGIEINIVNGVSGPLSLKKNHKYYINTFNLKVISFEFPAKDVLGWISNHSDFSGLSWKNISAVKNKWEFDGSAYTEATGYQGADWMNEEQVFIMEFIDSNNNVISEPLEFSSTNYIMPNLSALTWANGAPSQGYYGNNNSGDYKNITIKSTGAFLGLVEDIYTVQVETGGPIDGTSTVLITSIYGDNNEAPVSVQNNVPILLGKAGLGASIVFEGLTSQEELTEGDKWIIRCTPKVPGDGDSYGEVEAVTVSAPVPALASTFSASAKIHLTKARNNSKNFELPENVQSMKISWKGKSKSYIVPLQEPEETSVGYGLSIDLSIKQPENGLFYKSGDSVEMTLNLFDNDGNRLHKEGEFPTYHEFIHSVGFCPLSMRPGHEVPKGKTNGLLYFNSSNEAGLPYFNSNYINIFEVEVAGPKQLVNQSYEEGHTNDYFATGVQIPNIGRIVYGGFGNPELWDTPLYNSLSVELPIDAKPGTYVAIVKASRRFASETVNKMEVFEFQVGTETKTEFKKEVGNCKSCHFYDAALSNLRHGTSNYNVCKICHTRPHGTFSEIAHEIHIYAPAYPLLKHDCSYCHLSVSSFKTYNKAVCGSCHGEVHEGEFGITEHSSDDEYNQCAACHGSTSAGHISPAH